MKKKKNEVLTKVITLLIAVFLWSYVMGAVNPVISKDFRSVTVNLNNKTNLERQGLVLMSPQDLSINVKIEGNKNDMDNLTSSNILAKVDLSGYSEGQVKVPITVSIINQPSSIRVVSYEPREALFIFDSIVTKEIAVKVETQGELDNEHVLGEITSRPQTVIVRGPRTWVNEVDSAIALVNITGKLDAMEVAAPVKLVDSNSDEVRGVEKEPGIVDVTLGIDRVKEVPIEFVTSGELPEGFVLRNVSVAPLKAKLRGKANISALAKVETQTIELESLMGRESVEVQLNLPDDISLLDQAQRFVVSYKIEEIVEESFELKLKDAKLTGLKETLIVSEDSLEQSILVTLKGYKSAMDNLSIEMLRPMADLTGFEAGEHSITLEWNKIEDIEVKSVEPESITINVVER